MTHSNVAFSEHDGTGGAAEHLNFFATAYKEEAILTTAYSNELHGSNEETKQAIWTSS